MKRARLIETGWERDLVVDSVDGPGEPVRDLVTVEVEACGVCYRDCIDRAGRFKFIRLPVTPGHEVAGRVIAVGPGVTEWTVGDRVGTMHRGFCGACPACKSGEPSLCMADASVLGLLIDGGYASHVVAPQSCFFAVPDDMSAAAAAVMHCTFGTSYRGLSRFGRLSKGQRALITGANGGVGSAAVQVASRLGAEVIAVVRDASHTDYLTRLGASHVVVDDGGGFHKRLPGGRVDVAIDCVGQPTFNAALRSVRVGGRVVAVGNIVDNRVELNLGYIITSAIQIAGSSGANREDMAGVFALHAERPFDVEIHETMSLDRADAAQRLVLAGGLRGRIVLVP